MTSVGFTQCHPQGLNWPKSSALFWDFNHPRMGGYGLHWVAHINKIFLWKNLLVPGLPTNYFAIHQGSDDPMIKQISAGHLKGMVPPRELRAESAPGCGDLTGFKWAWNGLNASEMGVESYNALRSGNTGKFSLNVLKLFGWTQLRTLDLSCTLVRWSTRCWRKWMVCSHVRRLLGAMGCQSK